MIRGVALTLCLAGAAALADEVCDLSLGAATLARYDALVGLPVAVAGADGDDERRIFCHDRFCLGYNPASRAPDWVLARLVPEITDGDFDRPGIGFSPDARVLADGLATAVDSDYVKSGFDRGHMAASDDFKCSQEWMEQTFVFSNAVPQIGHGFNRDIWRALENRVKRFGRREEIFVLTGPVPMAPDGSAPELSAALNGCGNKIVLTGRADHASDAICGDASGGPRDCGDAGVAIPAGVFKIIYVPRTGRAFGFLMANQDHWPARNELGLSIDAYLARWRTSVSAIEQLAGLDFFPQFDLRGDHVVEDVCTPTRWR
ncbi:MAG: DNA/RNA non-specific endonuclease [Marinibacterium sp.]